MKWLIQTIRGVVMWSWLEIVIRHIKLTGTPKAMSTAKFRKFYMRYRHSSWWYIERRLENVDN